MGTNGLRERTALDENGTLWERNAERFERNGLMWERNGLHWEMNGSNVVAIRLRVCKTSTPVVINSSPNVPYLEMRYTGLFNMTLEKEGFLLRQALAC